MINMKLIEWKTEYSVNVPEIDCQHKEMMTFFNATVYNCSRDKKEEKNYFDKIIKPLFNFILRHFKMEEQYLIKTNYEKYEEHKTEHRKFLAELLIFKEDIETGTKEIDLSAITDYLKIWFCDHIMLFDKNAEIYFKAGRNKNDPNEYQFF